MPPIRLFEPHEAMMGKAFLAMPYLIQILLPVYDNDQHQISPSLHRQVMKDLKDQFGGLTAYTRSPAEGLWEKEGEEMKDEIVIYEVVMQTLNSTWWTDYRQTLEELFRQEQVMIRALSLQQL